MGYGDDKCNDCPNMAEAVLDGVPLCPGCYEETVFHMHQAWEEETAEGDWDDSPEDIDTEDTDDTDDDTIDDNNDSYTGDLLRDVVETLRASFNLTF